MEALTQRRRLARRLGWAVGGGFVLVMLAGADRPPPPGFVLVIGCGMLLGVTTARLLPAVLAVWDARGWSAAVGRAAAAGFAGALLLALLLLVSPGEPSVAVGPTDWLIWCAVTGFLGVLGAVGTTAVARLLDRRPVDQELPPSP